VASGFAMEAEVGQKRAILRPTEVGKLLGIRRSRVYALLRLGVLPSVRIAGTIWIPRPALEEWLDELSERALAITRSPESADADR